MNCPTCAAEEEVSTVNAETCVFTTDMAVWEFHDQEGQRHLHDPNQRTRRYSCSRGHRWTDWSVRSCWCGWPNGGTD